MAEAGATLAAAPSPIDPLDLADPRLHDILAAARAAPGPFVFLKGAGTSAESGIPTFRGAEGYWQVGSRNYHPQELATWSAFQRMPESIWAWYLYRRAVCNAAEPNPAHTALAELERRIGDRFLLVTQNVDGLHLRAGNGLQRTFQIHGNLDFSRCAAECGAGMQPMPDALLGWERHRELDAPARAHLRCPDCGGWLRPHVLWFDEYYDEEHYRFESSMQAAETCAVLVIIGTSGATNLPMKMGAIVARRGTPLIVVDPHPSPFSEMADGSPHGCFVQGAASVAVPAITAALAG